MAWTEKYAKGYRGRYWDAGGSKRTAGSVEGFTAKAKKEALQLAQREELKISGGTWFDPSSGKTTFSDYFENVWFPNASVELQSIVSYRSAYDAHFEAAFGSMELRKILPSHIQGFITGLSKPGANPRNGQPYAPATIVKLFGQLQSILAGLKGSSAQRDGYIERNVCAGTRLPKIPRREVTIYEPEEVDRLIECIPSWWRLLPLFMSETGVRLGEAQSVMVDDLTIGLQAIVIQRNLTETSAKWNDGTDAFRIKPYTKTGPNSQRTVALSLEVRRALIDHIAGRGLKPGDLLFSMPQRKAVHSKKGLMPTITSKKPARTERWPGGVPFKRKHFRNTIWARAHELTGIPERRVYDLRASNISWLLDGGAPVPVVMELVGHRRMQTTLGYTKARGVDTQGLDALAKVKAAKSQSATVTQLSSS